MYYFDFSFGIVKIENKTMKTMKKLNKTNLFMGIGLIAFVIGGVLLQNHFNSPERNTEFLKNHGYTSIHIGGYNLWCPKGSSLRREFTAVDPKGQEVEGSLCAGNLFISDKIDTKITSNTNKPKM
jgi:hypothetical protein